MTDDDGPDDRPTVRVPKYRRDGEVVEWTDVDAEWWDHVQHARAVYGRFVEEYGGEPGIEFIERGRGTSTIAGHATETLRVTVGDEAVRDTLDLPEELDGIPVIVEIDHITDSGR